MIALRKKPARQPDGYRVDSSLWPDAQPPGGFSYGTQWLGGTTYSDAFETKRSPTPYQLIERYGRLIYAMAERNKNAVSRLPLRLYADGSRAQGGRPRSLCDPAKVSRSMAERFVRSGNISGAAVDQVYEVRHHQMLDALDRPDPDGYFDRRSLIGLMTVSMDVLGGGHLVPGGNGWDYETGRVGTNAPEHLWVIYSQYATAVRWPGSPLIKEWWYFKDRIPFPNALWFRQGLSLRDPYGAAYGPTMAGEQYQDQEGRFVAWYDQFFSGARPNLVAAPKDAMFPPGEDVRKRHEQDLNRKHANGNAGGAIVTDGAYDYTPINYPPTDEGGVRLAEYDLYRLAAIFGQPPTYYTVDSNLANLQAADEQHARNGVEPRCWAIAGRLTRFVQMFDKRLFFAFDAAIQEDSESKEKVIAMRLASGRTTINQENEEERWPEVDWGKEPWLPSTLKQPSMIQAEHQMGLTTQAHAVANEDKATEFQYSEEQQDGQDGGTAGDSGATERALVDRALDRLEGELRWLKKGNPYHDDKGNFTHKGNEGHGGRAPKEPGKKREKSGETAKSRGPGGGGGKGSTKRHKMTAKEKADRVRKGKPAGYASDKARRAAEHQNKTDGKIQEYTKRNEEVFAGRVGGKSFPDNGPTDVELKIGGKNHGVELKTITHGANDKVTMKADAIARKVAWEKANGTQMHTVVLDHRDKGIGGADAAKLHSGNEIYYKRGVGSFRIGQMHKVEGEAELKKLMATTYDKLPAAAQGPKRGTVH